MFPWLWRHRSSNQVVIMFFYCFCTDQHDSKWFGITSWTISSDHPRYGNASQARVAGMFFVVNVCCCELLLSMQQHLLCNFWWVNLLNSAFFQKLSAGGYRIISKDILMYFFNVNVQGAQFSAKSKGFKLGIKFRYSKVPKIF